MGAVERLEERLRDQEKMLQAVPTRFHQRFFTLYFRRRARRKLAAVMVRGLSRMAPWSPNGKADAPLLIVANHSSWWDAVLPILLSLDAMGHRAYGIMDVEQLERYGFFRRLGMFSVDTKDPRSALKSLIYAADLLRDRNNVLWIFPQGRIVPNDVRPIEIYPGAARIIRLLKGPCRVLPVAFRYELGSEEHPTAYVGIGPSELMGGENFDERAATRRIAEVLTLEVDRLRDDVVNRRMDGFVPLLAGRSSVNSWWDRLRGKEQRDRKH